MDYLRDLHYAYRVAIKYFIGITILLSLLANLIVSLDERDFGGLLSFRNLFLLAFLSCFIFYKKWSTVLLIIINISFWYFYVSTSLSISFHNHPKLPETFTEATSSDLNITFSSRSFEE